MRELKYYLAAMSLILGTVQKNFSWQILQESPQVPPIIWLQKFCQIVVYARCVF